MMERFNETDSMLLYISFCTFYVYNDLFDEPNKVLYSIDKTDSWF